MDQPVITGQQGQRLHASFYFQSKLLNWRLRYADFEKWYAIHWFFTAACEIFTILKIYEVKLKGSKKDCTVFVQIPPFDPRIQGIFNVQLTK